MLIYNLRLAFRNMAKNKGYSTINLFGLAIGLASFVIIMLYVYDELSFDQFHTDSDRIYRVVFDRTERDGSKSSRIDTPGALKEAMIDEIPEIEHATRLNGSTWVKALLANKKYTYFDKNLLYVGTSFFDVFSFQFIDGEAHTAFVDPSSIVLTESIAHRFFGSKEALGKTLTFNQNQPLKVTGVIEDVPTNSHLQFDFLISRTVANRPGRETNWGQGHMHTYIKVIPQANLQEVDAKIQRLMETHHQFYLEEMQVEESYFAQPMTSIHLSPPRLWEMTPGGNKLYIQVLLMVAFFILFIAGINYVNLATARSAMRAKEIGVRKVVGALRKAVIYQFLMESILMSVVAGCMAVALTEVVLPLFNNLMQKDLSLLATGSFPIWLGIAAAVLVFGLAAGLYPAFYLSAFKPISVFRKHLTSKKGGFDLRKTLVVSQFALSAFLLVGIIVVQQQISYIQSADLGFDKDQVLVIDGLQKSPTWMDRNNVVRKKLATIPGVLRVGGTHEMEIGLKRGGTGSGKLKGTDNAPVVTAAYLADEGFLEVFGLEWIEGRNFSHEFSFDMNGHNAIVNETSVRHLGIQGSALGQKIVWPNGGENTIIGVVKDFHTSSLHDEIFPVIIRYNPSAWYAVLKLSGGQIRETLVQIEEVWNEFVPGTPIDFYFMDDKINQLYRSERNFHIIFSAMTSLALIIACLGLFGLVAFTAEQRTKEIGIRKVLGASVANITALLSGDFLKLVALANLIAWPVAFYAMNKWLQNFAYRIEIGWWVFALAGGLALVIALLTVSLQAIRAALANPVDSLRYE